jgi:hypothetical protein
LIINNSFQKGLLTTAHLGQKTRQGPKVYLGTVSFCFKRR